MSATKLFSLNRRLAGLFLPALLLAGRTEPVWAQAVPSQANIDASAQRRLQETMQEAQRQRRIEQQIQRLHPALNSEKMSGPGGPVLARKALAALVRLREEGISPEDSLARATRSAGIDSSAAAKTSAYLRNLLSENSGKITADLLTRLEAGEDPAPALTLPPFRP